VARLIKEATQTGVQAKVEVKECEKPKGDRGEIVVSGVSIYVEHEVTEGR
jgi:hypothetical protein